MIADQWITKIGVSFWNTVKSQNQYSLAKQIDFVSYIGLMLFMRRVWDQEVILFQSMKEAVTDGMK